MGGLPCYQQRKAIIEGKKIYTISRPTSFSKIKYVLILKLWIPLQDSITLWTQKSVAKLVLRYTLNKTDFVYRGVMAITILSKKFQLYLNPAIFDRQSHQGLLNEGWLMDSLMKRTSHYQILHTFNILSASDN